MKLLLYANVAVLAMLATAWLQVAGESLTAYSGVSTMSVPYTSAEASSSMHPFPTATRVLYATPTPALPPAVREKPPITYGNLSCEPYYSGGYCQLVLQAFPAVVTNWSRSSQGEASFYANAIFSTLTDFKASQSCLNAAIPLLCQYSFPTCDPAFDIPVYQPICRRSCELMRDFICRKPWQQMLQLIEVLDLGEIIDEPNCDPLFPPNAGSAPMCIDTLDVGTIPSYLLSDDCYTGRGRGYNGTVSVTVSNRTCQAWNTTYPHQHLLGFNNLPELAGGHNYCRNPGERGERPWCFTLDRSQRWEYCDVPMCDSGPTCQYYQNINGTESLCWTRGGIGLDYTYFNTSIGKQSDYELSLKNLQRSIEDFKQAECRETVIDFVCSSNLPSCAPSASTPVPQMPCRRYCEEFLTKCREDVDGIIAFKRIINFEPLIILNDCSEFPEDNGGDAPECWMPITLPQAAGGAECYNQSGRGLAYNGTVSVTESGKVCQAWSEQSPHAHPLTPLFRSYLEGHNYCRNPEQRGERPWCYTTDPSTRWEYCDVPVCASLDYLTIGLAAGAGFVLFWIVVIFIPVVLCCCCIKRQKSSYPHLVREDRYVEASVNVKTIGMQPLDQKPAAVNPLYTPNPLSQQQPLEYDGIKLPEYARENIVYIRDLGQGHFGVVVQAQAMGIIPGEECSTVAIKVLKQDSSGEMKQSFFREATLMHTFDHPNILRLLGVCIREEPLCMIFEFMEFGDLNNFLRENKPGKWECQPNLKTVTPPINARELVCLTTDIATGLEYLAQNRYVHRDLATRNCLVNNSMRVKIADFGLSQDVYSKDYFRLGDSELLPIRWMPPEAIMYAKFTTQSDVWSFGVVLWEVFSYGMQPYYSMSNEEVVQHVRDGNVMSCPEGCPPEIFDLMLDCWAMEPSERPTASELHAGLGRWSPGLSASLSPPLVQGKGDYQNMATIREYAMRPADQVDKGVDLESTLPEHVATHAVQLAGPAEEQVDTELALSEHTTAPEPASFSLAFHLVQHDTSLTNGTGYDTLAPKTADEHAM